MSTSTNTVVYFDWKMFEKKLYFSYFVLLFTINLRFGILLTVCSTLEDLSCNLAYFTQVKCIMDWSWLFRGAKWTQTQNYKPFHWIIWEILHRGYKTSVHFRVFSVIFSVFCVVLLCVLTFWVPCCDVRYNFCIKSMLGLSLPPVVCGRVHVSLTYSGVQHILCCVLVFLLLLLSCVPFNAGFSGLTFFYCPFGVL